MSRSLRICAQALACLLLFAAGALAQSRINGRVVDAQGNAMAGIEVLLHAITESAGNEVDRDTTAADGRFDLAATDPNPNAVYFVAVTHEGQLYIGDLLRPPFQLTEDYVVRVGVNPVDLSGGAASEAVPPPPAPGDRTAGSVVIVITVLVVAALLFFLLRARAPPRRRWLVELAKLEEELAASEEPPATLVARRQELRDRLLNRKRD